jgi:hypothetical protein
LDFRQVAGVKFLGDNNPDRGRDKDCFGRVNSSPPPLRAARRFRFGVPVILAALSDGDRSRWTIRKFPLSSAEMKVKPLADQTQLR